MSVIDFHPDDLLDREARGQLSPSERVRLGDHLARCATCRLERMMRADFAEDVGRESVTRGLASHVSIALQQATVQAADGAPPRRARVRTRFGAFMVAAALLCVGGVAAARTGIVESTIAAARAQVEIVLGQKQKPKRKNPPRRTTREPKPGTAVAEMAPVVQPVEVEAPVLEPTRARRARHVASPSAPTPSQSESELAFERATEARKGGDAERAIAAYRALIASYPQSSEAQLSRALLGRLLLDLGRAGMALHEFEAYLESHARGLREDALAGRARALEKLGRGTDARAAYAELLREFPHTSYAAWAEGQRGRD